MRGGSGSRAEGSGKPMKPTGANSVGGRYGSLPRDPGEGAGGSGIHTLGSTNGNGVGGEGSQSIALLSVEDGELGSG